MFGPLKCVNRVAKTLETPRCEAEVDYQQKYQSLVGHTAKISIKNFLTKSS